jgi:hypothetical protein
LWNLYKKKLPENFQCIVEKDVGNRGCYKLHAKKIGYIRPKPKCAGKVKKRNHIVEVSKLTQPAAQSKNHKLTSFM